MFRHPDGDERKVVEITDKNGVKTLVVIASVARDYSNSVKFLIRSLERRIVDGGDELNLGRAGS